MEKWKQFQEKLLFLCLFWWKLFCLKQIRLCQKLHLFYVESTILTEERWIPLIFCSAGSKTQTGWTWLTEELGIFTNCGLLVFCLRFQDANRMNLMKWSSWFLNWTIYLSIAQSLLIVQNCLNLGSLQRYILVEVDLL